jgi:hypothetical protein
VSYDAYAKTLDSKKKTLEDIEQAIVNSKRGMRRASQRNVADTIPSILKSNLDVTNSPRERRGSMLRVPGKRDSFMLLDPKKKESDMLKTESVRETKPDVLDTVDKKTVTINEVGKEEPNGDNKDKEKKIKSSRGLSAKGRPKTARPKSSRPKSSKPKEKAKDVNSSKPKNAKKYDVKKPNI